MKVSAIAESIRITGGGGDDHATIADSAGKENLIARTDWVTLTDADLTYDNDLKKFVSSDTSSFQYSVATDVQVEAQSTEGTDQAYFLGSAAAETFRSSPTTAIFEVPGVEDVLANNFPEVHAYGKGGHDMAFMEDSPGKDRFVSTWVYARFAGEGHFQKAVRFEEVLATATPQPGAPQSEWDVAVFEGSRQNDIADGTPTEAWMKLGYKESLASARFVHTARGFQKVKFEGDNAGENLASARDYNPATDDVTETAGQVIIENHDYVMTFLGYSDVQMDPATAALLAANAPSDDEGEEQLTDAAIAELFSQD
jgi:hypothetical protein